MAIPVTRGLEFVSEDPSVQIQQGFVKRRESSDYTIIGHVDDDLAVSAFVIFTAMRPMPMPPDGE